MSTVHYSLLVPSSPGGKGSRRMQPPAPSSSASEGQCKAPCPVTSGQDSSEQGGQKAKHGPFKALSLPG